MALTTTRWFVLVAVAMLWAGPAPAQQEVVTPEEQEAVPAPPEGGQEAQPAAGGKTQTEAEHTVVPGDTLWDLCARYLNNPWYWPRVWSYNPEISNPHWIYPGQVVRFYPTGELPGEMLAGGEMEVPEPVEEEEEPELVPEQMVQLTGRIVRARTVRSVSILRDAFITSEELDELGTITGSFEEKEYLAQYDKVYVKFKDQGAAQVGKRLVFIRTVKKVFHPITEEFRGYYTRVLGAGQVVAVEGDIATVVISTSLDPIFRGDRVTPWVAELSKNVAPRRNGVELKGYIMDARVAICNLGERHVVFIDQGSEQGVEEGNIFDVVRREDGYMAQGETRRINTWDKSVPMEILGRIMVVDARPTASTGIVLASLRELRIGDRVLMTTQ
ncbi:MAG: peptidoglycan-binding protein [Deltaproteobacteria bacterium]|nr:MAG: peptidoglycan-binding protein [Deltaproteobacteria bacterium]